MRELTSELSGLFKLARAAAAGEYEVDALLNRIASAVADNFGFARVVVLRQLEGGRLQALAGHGLPGAAAEQVVHVTPLFERALRTGETIYVEEGDEAVLPRELGACFGCRSVVVMPFFAEGECLGFLAADCGADPCRIDQHGLDLLTTIGAVIAAFLGRAIQHDELERLNELKSHFIALASHELRTPATIIHGIAATLHHRGEELSGEQRRRLDHTLFEQTERLSRLIDQLLDLSRLEAKTMAVNRMRLPVRRRLEELVRDIAAERRDEIALDVDDELEALIDAEAFDHIVGNLVTNALRYGAPPVVVRAEQNDRHFRLVVVDHGDGVPPEFEPRLFERFARADGSKEKVKDGTGLGLAIAQSYAQAHGGQIFYEGGSAGARFQLVLPSLKSVE